MVIDTSAILSVLFGEDDMAFYTSHLVKDGRKVMTPLNALEADIVVEARKGQEGRKELDLFLYHCAIEVLPFDNAMRTLAAEAWRQYGKGRHPAGLNMGDCCSYALAKYLMEPLLFKGEDFSRTDITSVL